MDLPKTLQGNQYVMYSNMFTKWALVFAIPDQKTEKVARQLIDEIIPFLECLSVSCQTEALIYFPKEWTRSYRYSGVLPYREPDTSAYVKDMCMSNLFSGWVLLVWFEVKGSRTPS